MTKNPGLRPGKFTGGDEEKAKGRPLDNKQNKAEMTRNRQGRQPMSRGPSK